HLVHNESRRRFHECPRQYGQSEAQEFGGIPPAADRRSQSRPLKTGGKAEPARLRRADHGGRRKEGEEGNSLVGFSSQKCGRDQRSLPGEGTGCQVTGNVSGSFCSRRGPRIPACRVETSLDTGLVLCDSQASPRVATRHAGVRAPLLPQSLSKPP